MPTRTFRFEFKYKLTNGYCGSGSIVTDRPIAEVPKLVRKRFNLSLGAEIYDVRRVAR